MILHLLSAAGTIVSVAVGVLAAGLVALAIAAHFVRKKKGKTGCGCDCSACGGCNRSAPRKQGDANGRKNAE